MNKWLFTAFIVASVTISIGYIQSTSVPEPKQVVGMIYEVCNITCQKEGMFFDGDISVTPKNMVCICEVWE